jgi:hypothetical protein
MTTKKTDEAKAPGLFGPDDQLINALELEVKMVAAEILSCRKAIARKDTELGDLQDRHKRLTEALATVRPKATIGGAGKKPAKK